MRKLIGFTIIIMLTTKVFGQGIEFFEGNLESLKSEAQRQDKIIFIDAYTTWCGPCKWMSRNTFSDEQVGGFYNHNFISYKLDMEKGEGIQFAKAYEVKAFPTLLFIDYNDNLVHRKIGALNPEQFLVLGEIALDSERNLGGVIQKYKQGERSPAFMRNYLRRLANARIDVKEASDWYFSTQSNEELLTKENFELISLLIKDPNHVIFKFALENREAYKEITGEDQVDKYFFTVFQAYVYKAKKQNKESYDEAIELMLSSDFDQSDKLMAGIELSDLSKSGEWILFADKLTSYLLTYEKNNDQLRNRYAWMFYKNSEITDKELLKKAIQWSKESVELNPNYPNSDTYAALLYKIGQTEAALEAAKRAILIAEEGGIDSSATSALIEKIYTSQPQGN